MYKTSLFLTIGAWIDRRNYSKNVKKSYESSDLCGYIDVHGKVDYQKCNQENYVICQKVFSFKNLIL